MNFMETPRKPGDSYLDRSQGFIQDSFPSLMRCSSSALAGQFVCLYVRTLRVSACMCAIIIPVSCTDTGPTPPILLTEGPQWKPLRHGLENTNIQIQY